MQKNKEKYGFWRSPLTESTLSKLLIPRGLERIIHPTYQGNDIYFIKVIPNENNRRVFLKYDHLHKKIKIITPSSYSLKTNLDEYDGLPFVLKENLLYFVNQYDQSIYCQDVYRGSIEKIVEGDGYNYGYLVVDKENRNLYCVRKRRTNSISYRQEIVKIDLCSRKIEVLFDKHEYYSYITLNPDNNMIAFRCWDNPHMPWNCSYLYVIELNRNGDVKHIYPVIKNKHTSINDPMWSVDNSLYFTYDKNGWYQIYRVKNLRNNPELIIDIKADFSDKLFGLGNRKYGLLDDRHIFAVGMSEKGQQCCFIDVNTKKIKEVKLPFTYYSYVSTKRDRILFVAADYTSFSALYEYDFSGRQLSRITGSIVKVKKEYISIPEKICYTTSGGDKAWGYLYRPKNKHYKVKNPTPLIINVHGGPTSYHEPVFDPAIQYFTTRGFTVFSVDYRGSYGYGKEYRDKLKGKWGLIDVDDCIFGVLYLYKKGLIDINKVFIRGRSAGGYIVLQSLVRSRLFRGGVSYFGVSNILQLRKQTIDLIKSYFDWLVGTYPEQKEKYKIFSPFYNVKFIDTPILFLQGGCDRIVPLNQAEKMHKVLRKKGVKSKLVFFRDESHGFTKKDNIVTSLREELKFYQLILNKVYEY